MTWLTLIMGVVLGGFAVDGYRNQITITEDSFTALEPRWFLNGPPVTVRFDDLASLAAVEKRGRHTTRYEVCEFKSGQYLIVDFSRLRRSAWTEVSAAARAKGVSIRQRYF